MPTYHKQAPPRTKLKCQRNCRNLSYPKNHLPNLEVNPNSVSCNQDEVSNTTIAAHGITIAFRYGLSRNINQPNSAANSANTHHTEPLNSFNSFIVLICFIVTIVIYVAKIIISSETTKHFPNYFRKITYFYIQLA